MPPEKVPTIEEYNKENIFLRSKLNDIKSIAFIMADQVKGKGDTNLAVKIQHIGILAHRALEKTK